VVADYRVRSQIRESLEKNYFRNQNQPYATNIAFQLAFCYLIGFGIKSDDNVCRLWLQRSTKSLNDLKIEKDTVRRRFWKNGKMQQMNARLLQIDVVHEYRTWGLKKLDEARVVYEREIRDMIREFGELHFISLELYSIFGDLLDQLGQFEKSKELRIWVRDETEKQQGVGHPDTLRSIIYLASTYRNQGQLKKAEEMDMRVLDTIKLVLDKEHPSTLTSMSNLAYTYRKQGRWKEAVEL